MSEKKGKSPWRKYNKVKYQYSKQLTTLESVIKNGGNIEEARQEHNKYLRSI